MLDSTSRFYVRSIFLSGFKSFSSDFPQTFEFCDGLNVIHGHNGAGKSNVLDGLAFAMTAREKDLRVSRLRQLIHCRGSLQDACATVEVVFAPCGHSAPSSGTSHQVLTAKLYRDSDERKYKWQGKAKTQQEIRRCLRLVGVDMDQPSFLIYQNTVTTLLARSPEDIAALILQASGGAMYSAAVAEAKSFLASSPLHRVDEGIDAASLSLSVAQRQASGVARLRAVEASLAEAGEGMKRASAAVVVKKLARATELVGTLAEEEERLAQHTTRLAATEHHLREAHSAALSELEAHRAAMSEDSLAVRTVEEDIAVLREDCRDLRVQWERAREGEASAANHTAELKAALAQLYSLLSAEQERHRLLSEKAKALKESKHAPPAVTQQEVEAASREVETLQGRICEAEKELHALREHAGEKRRMRDEALQRVGPGGKARLKKCADELQTLEAAYAELVAEHRRKSHVLHSTQADLDRYHRNPLGSSHGPVLGLVALPPHAEEWATALNVAARGRWGVEVCSSVVEMKQVFNEARGRGRAVTVWVLPELPVPTKTTRDAMQQVKEKHGAVLPRELLDFDPKYTAVVHKLFNNVVLVEKETAATQLAARGFTAVTRAGICFHPGGRRVSGGYTDPAANPLQAQSRLGGFRDEVDDLAKQVAKKEEEIAVLRDHLQKANAELIEVAALEKGVLSAVGAVNEKERALHRLQQQLMSLKVRIELGQSDANETVKRTGRRKGQQPSKQKLEEAMAGVEAHLSELREAVAAKEAELSVAEHSSRLVDPDTAEDRLVQVSDELRHKEKELSTLQERVLTLEEKITSLEGEAAACAARVDAVVEELRSKRTCLREVEQAGKAAHTTAVKLQKEHDVLPLPLRESVSMDTSLEDDEDRLLRLQTEVRELQGEGDALRRVVNPKAVKGGSALDHEAHRVAEWTSKRALVSEGIAVLRGTVERAAAMVHRANCAAFEHIALRAFPQYFAVLFKTKVARVVALDPADLAKGVRVEVSRQGSDGAEGLDSLSGGQKTLLSVAFVAAVASFRKGAFYGLDEVDAALDEENRERLAELICTVFRGDQVICISHHAALHRKADRTFHVEGYHGRSHLTAPHNTPSVPSEAPPAKHSKRA